jgi:hypothetical protein
MIKTRLAYEAACAVYDKYIAEGRTSGDDSKFLSEISRQLADYDRRCAEALLKALGYDFT